MHFRPLKLSPRHQAKSFHKDDGDLTWFVSALEKAFPECNSEHDLSIEVAKFLTRKGRRVEPRTVRYWLRGETTPHFNYVWPILVLAGSEAVFERLFGTGGRS